MFFPLFVDIGQKNILVVGAGTIATRRVAVLCRFASRITVVAPEISDALVRLAQEDVVTICRRRFEVSDLDHAELVFAATDDAKLNQEIAVWCRERRIPVNVSSDAGLCDFQFPSVVCAGSAVIGINASGTNHRLVKETRKKIEQCMGVPKQEGLYPMHLQKGKEEQHVE